MNYKHHELINKSKRYKIIRRSNKIKRHVEIKNGQNSKETQGVKCGKGKVDEKCEYTSHQVVSTYTLTFENVQSRAERSVLEFDDVVLYSSPLVKTDHVSRKQNCVIK